LEALATTGGDPMVEGHPIDGIGVRMFHSLGSTTARCLPPFRSTTTQNWFRHHIAGWHHRQPAAVVVVCRAADGCSRSRAIVCRVACCAAVIGFGVASMFGMPAQSLAII
jgi:hypothetical protein